MHNSDCNRIVNSHVCGVCVCVCVQMGGSGEADFVYVPVYPPSETLQH